MRLLALVLAAVMLAAAPATALAAGCPRTSVTDIEDEVMCLQCGVPLNLSEDAPSAKRERAFIQQRVDRCQTKQQIKDELVAQFGDRILAEPKSGTAWLVPALAFGGGALAVGYAAYRWRRQRMSTAPPTTPAGAAVSASDS
ncbi:MAG: cytochrome c-type biosis protein CcmH, partial [Thermoleophilaceae bacterium]|nr:cytochrome c-type biosis protein CcmH [Thermoleophilaceae bacterium]